MVFESGMNLKAGVSAVWQSVQVGHLSIYIAWTLQDTENYSKLSDVFFLESTLGYCSKPHNQHASLPGLASEEVDEVFFEYVDDDQFTNSQRIPASPSHFNVDESSLKSPKEDNCFQRLQIENNDELDQLFATSVKATSFPTRSSTLGGLLGRVFEPHLTDFMATLSPSRTKSSSLRNMKPVENVAAEVRMRSQSQLKRSSPPVSLFEAKGEQNKNFGSFWKCHTRQLSIISRSLVE